MPSGMGGLRIFRSFRSVPRIHLDLVLGHYDQPAGNQTMRSNDENSLPDEPAMRSRILKNV
jgi:hypothetical protein